MATTVEIMAAYISETKKSAELQKKLEKMENSHREHIRSQGGVFSANLVDGIYDSLQSIEKFKRECEQINANLTRTAAELKIRLEMLNGGTAIFSPDDFHIEQYEFSLDKDGKIQYSVRKR